MRRAPASVFPILLLAFFAQLAACVKRPPSSLELLEDAAKSASSGGASAKTLSFAGLHALWVKGSAKDAERFFSDALAADPSEPWAHYGQLLLSMRQAEPSKGLAAAFEILEKSPRHPLAVPAARVVFDAVGTSKATDEGILERAAKLEAGPALLPDAALLLRSAVANVYLARDDQPALTEALKKMGAPTKAALSGPWSAWHNLALLDVFTPEVSGWAVHGDEGPCLSDTCPRVLDYPDGRLSLSPEAALGDVFYVYQDFTLKEPGELVLRSSSAMDHLVFIDGTKILERRTVDRPRSTVTARALSLGAGPHRMMVKLSRDDSAGFLAVQLMRADGQAMNLDYRHPLKGPSKWAPDAVVVHPELPFGVFPDAASLAKALAAEAGEGVSALVAARDSLTRDRDGARRLLASVQKELNGPAVAMLRADLELSDRLVPAKVARGRATRDLEAALEKDPGFVHAVLVSAQLALDDGRNTDALELVQRAKSVAGKNVPAAVYGLEARVYLLLGADAAALASAKEAEKARPADCDALGLRYDVARRRDASKEADEVLTQLEGCPGATSRKAEHLRSRGQLEAAAVEYQKLLARDPGQATLTTALVNTLVGLKRYDDAVKALVRLTLLWPRSANLHKQLADVYEISGRRELALKERERALALDGSDLTLRRAVERARTGKELLDPWAISTEEALKAYAAAPGNEDVPSAYVLDAAAVQVFGDGSQVDRIHIIQKALDQSGVAEVAEVNLPNGAQVLKLRTLKPDGRTLEAELLAKESISLPNVQVGDFVEQEYLLAHPARGPAVPGFTASSFYFQIARQPNNWSTYVVVAPKGTELKVEAHNMKAPQPKEENGFVVFDHAERRVPPYIPEPNGPMSQNEFLPFVTVGAGATGNESIVSAYADAFIDRGAVSYEVEKFATDAAAGKTGVDAVRALYVAVMQKLSGRDSGLSLSAAASVAQDRGSRLWLLRASLTALGIESRIAVVRTFSADPAPYLFPNEGLLPYLCLRATVRTTDASGAVQQQFVWLDPLVRFAPFGELPETAAGREAYLMPEPGRPLEKTTTPPKVNRPGKQVELQLELTEDGVLSGIGSERYQGYEAAQLAEALESINPEQRDQALQGALSRYFGGAELSKLKLTFEREVGGEVRVEYEFKAPRFARSEGPNRLVFSNATFPVLLGRRYVALSQRSTPLYLESSETSRTHATLKVPKGFKVGHLLPEIKSSSQWGSYVRKEKQEGELVTLDEDFVLRMARIPPDGYDEFVRFAGETDLAQGRDLAAER